MPQSCAAMLQHTAVGERGGCLQVLDGAAGCSRTVVKASVCRSHGSKRFGWGARVETAFCSISSVVW